MCNTTMMFLGISNVYPTSASPCASVRCLACHISWPFQSIIDVLTWAERSLISGETVRSCCWCEASITCHPSHRQNVFKVRRARSNLLGGFPQPPQLLLQLGCGEISICLTSCCCYAVWPSWLRAATSRYATLLESTWCTPSLTTALMRARLER